MAYPTGLEETRAGTLSAHPGYVCRLGENGRGRFEWENDGDECRTACRGRGGRGPGNGHPYQISSGYVFE